MAAAESGAPGPGVRPNKFNEVIYEVKAVSGADRLTPVVQENVAIYFEYASETDMVGRIHHIEIADKNKQLITTIYYRYNLSGVLVQAEQYDALESQVGIIRWIDGKPAMFLSPSSSLSIKLQFSGTGLSNFFLFTLDISSVLLELSTAIGLAAKEEGFNTSDYAIEFFRDTGIPPQQDPEFGEPLGSGTVRFKNLATGLPSVYMSIWSSRIFDSFFFPGYPEKGFTISYGSAVSPYMHYDFDALGNFLGTHPSDHASRVISVELAKVRYLEEHPELSGSLDGLSFEIKINWSGGQGQTETGGFASTYTVTVRDGSTIVAEYDVNKVYKNISGVYRVVTEIYNKLTDPEGLNKLAYIWNKITGFTVVYQWVNGELVCIPEYLAYCSQGASGPN